MNKFATATTSYHRWKLFSVVSRYFSCLSCTLVISNFLVKCNNLLVLACSVFVSLYPSLKSEFLPDSCFLKLHLIPQDDRQSSLDDILWGFRLSFSDLNAHGITLTLNLISIVHLYHLKWVHWDCSPHLPTKNDIVSSIYICSF